MFVVSLSSKRIKWLLIVILAFGILTSAFIALFYCENSNSEAEYISVNNSASNIDELLVFISGFGWEVKPEPDEIREIIIPAEFDDVYKKYNEIQLSQGYDLRDYAGERAKNWTFSVSNYPGYENEEYIKINILTCNGKVIGGDICSVKLDGFMHGFIKD